MLCYQTLQRWTLDLFGPVQGTFGTQGTINSGIKQEELGMGDNCSSRTLGENRNTDAEKKILEKGNAQAVVDSLLGQAPKA